MTGGYSRVALSASPIWVITEGHMARRFASPNRFRASDDLCVSSRGRRRRRRLAPNVLYFAPPSPGQRGVVSQKTAASVPAPCQATCFRGAMFHVVIRRAKILGEYPTGGEHNNDERHHHNADHCLHRFLPVVIISSVGFHSVKKDRRKTKRPHELSAIKSLRVPLIAPAYRLCEDCRESPYGKSSTTRLAVGRPLTGFGTAPQITQGVCRIHT